jgi:hypothetical protein
MLSTAGRENGKEPLSGSSLEVSAMDSIKFPCKSCSWQASVPLSAALFLTKTKQQCFKLIQCLLFIGPDRLENDTVAAIQVGTDNMAGIVSEHRKDAPAYISLVETFNLPAVASRSTLPV